MAMDEPSAQLHENLRRSVQDALRSRRPILHHLNADTSWLLQVPRPDSAVRHGGRFFYNILIDPWLAGGQSDVAKWFSQQFHATPSAVASIAEVEELAREIEILADGLRLGKGRKINAQTELENGRFHSFVDAVAISHEFTDHCHKETLLEVHPDTPVFAAKEAAKLISGWGHFRTVLDIPIFGGKENDWQSTSVPPLPDWLGIGRLLSTRDTFEYHSALLIAFSSTLASKNDDDETAEAVIYTPHGIVADDITFLSTAQPPVKTLAFLHGLHDIALSKAQQLNLGGHNGLRAQRLLKAKYWIGTHDEVKRGGGLVAWFLKRKVISLKDALEQERHGTNGFAMLDEDTRDVLGSFEDTHWEELGNGESRILH